MALKSLWQRITRIDLYLILALALFCIISLWQVMGRQTGSRLVVFRGDEVAYVGPLNQDRLLDIAGPLGDTRVKIANGEVRILTSPCPRKLCLSFGEVRKSGDLLACVPNRVVVRIEGQKVKSYDLLSR